jgi:5'-3' exonuclease
LIHLIFSNDNDFKQLLTNEVERNIFIYDFQFKRIISKINFKKYYKHTPESILYTKIFIGDASDNIEGLPNVGKVTGEKYYQ